MDNYIFSLLNSQLEQFIFFEQLVFIKNVDKKDKVKCAYKLYVYLNFAAMRTLNERMHHIRCVQKEGKKDREFRGA